MKLSIKFFILFLAIESAFSYSPYQLSWETDGYILGTGLTAGLTALIIDSKLDKITQEEINKLSTSDINAFDRLRMGKYSAGLSATSDVFLLGMASLPAGFLFDSKSNNDIVTIASMYFETMLIAGAIPYITKGSVQRFRPYTYEEDLEFSIKEDAEGRRSFFSGHSATSFASAVFLSKVYSDYFPDSKYIPYIWAGSLLLATTVAIMRIESGKHFLTDVITGAIFGSLVGYIVPELHKIKNNTNDFSIRVTPINIGISYSF